MKIVRSELRKAKSVHFLIMALYRSLYCIVLCVHMARTYV